MLYTCVDFYPGPSRIGGGDGRVGRRHGLVSQYLENISREALVKHQQIIRRYIRGREGVYALYRKDRLYYVGLAGNLRGRLTQHIRDRHGASWDRFSVYLTIGDAHLRELESLVLRIVKPTGNKQKGKFGKSENLRPRFKRDVRAKQDVELVNLLGVDVRSPTPENGLEKRGRRPVLAAYSDRPKTLRARFKGTTLKARVLRDGSIRYQGRLYNSPSRAAAKACGRRTCDGWIFWTYERAPGDWVPLATLRETR